MASPGRSVASILLVLAGLACAAFFGLLLGIADCSTGCQERGERAPVYALIGLGLGAIVTGAMLGSGARKAFGSGLLAAGALALSGMLIVLVMENGRGGIVWVTLALGIVALVAGAWLAFAPARD